MPPLHRVFLVGPMGAGKTTIGKYLAQHLKLRFADTDAEIESRTGADIPWIFDVEGEEGFRDREQQVVAEMNNELTADQIAKLDNLGDGDWRTSQEGHPVVVAARARRRAARSPV